MGSLDSIAFSSAIGYHIRTNVKSGMALDKMVSAANFLLFQYPFVTLNRCSLHSLKIFWKIQ